MTHSSPTRPRSGEPEPLASGALTVMRELCVRAARHGVEIDTTTNDERRRLVLRYPDLADRLTQPPLSYSRPEQWHGYIPPRTDPPGERYLATLNGSPHRAALVEIYEEAVRRDREDSSR